MSFKCGAVTYTLSCMQQEHIVVKDKQLEVLQELYRGNNVFEWAMASLSATNSCRFRLITSPSVPVLSSWTKHHYYFSPCVTEGGASQQPPRSACCRWYTQAHTVVCTNASSNGLLNTRLFRYLFREASRAQILFELNFYGHFDCKSYWKCSTCTCSEHKAFSLLHSKDWGRG